MSKAENKPDPHAVPAMVGEKHRQATGLFKGVDFQIWLTVAAWIDLSENQILMIEGVEDFDIVNKDSGIVTQAKALAQPISLRSQSVMEAIRNFWQAKHRNPDRDVRYRFVTTAAFSVEAGKPFESEIAGLSLWTSEARSPQPTESSEKLRLFLINDNAVQTFLGNPFPTNVPSLLEFLRNSNAATVFKEIIQPVSWLQSHDGIDAAREAVSVKIHAYGEQRGILPGDCDRALPHLFTFVAHTAYKEHRILEREDFRLEFEKSVKPGPGEMANLKLVAALARQVLGQSGAESSLPVDKTESLDTPRLPNLCVPRITLVNQLSESIAANGFAALNGSTGKGKSTLAKLVTANATGPWAWFSFSGMDIAGISNWLDHVAHFAVSKNSSRLVLDNLDVPIADEARIANKLATLYFLVSNSGGQIIVTAQRPLPSVFFRETGVPESAKIAVPNLTREEIQTLCHQAGCPEGQQLLAHAAIIFAQTSGHPQLVNAAVSTRRDQGWPAPIINQILEQAPEIIEERKMARQLLDHLSTDEVELLNRLSLLSMSFRRDQAIAISEITPSLAHPGNCFDKLVGPWIESSSGNRYRLSTLLARAAEENCSTDRISYLRGEIGRALLRSKNLTQWEASEILLNAVAIQDPMLALPVLKALFVSTMSERASWAEALWWLLAFSETKAVFPTNRMVDFLFRQIQFRLAVSSNHEQTIQFAENLMSEAEKLKEAKAQDLLIAGTASDILLAIKMLLPPATLLRCWLNIVSVLQSSKILQRVAHKLEQDGRRRIGLGKKTFSELFFAFILYRRGGCDFVSKFVESVNELDDSNQQRVLGALRANEPGLRYFVDQAWIQEGTKNNPEWEKIIITLHNVWKTGASWSFPELIAIAARGISIIYDEYLNMPNEALAILNKAKEETGTDLTTLRYQRGNIFYRGNQFSDAYNEWRTVNAEMKTDDSESAADALCAYPKFGQVAGQLENWEEASKIFLEGRELAQREKAYDEATAFGVDAAHSLWLCGRKAESLSLFGSCLEELESQAGEQEPEGFHTLWKLTEHIVRWCSINAGAPGEKFEINRVGLCSEHKGEERHNLIKDRPRAPIILTWISLVDAEHYGNLGRTTYDRLISRQDGGWYPGPRVMKASLILRRAFRDRQFADLPLMIEEIGNAGAVVKEDAGKNYFAYCPNPKIPNDVNSIINSFAETCFNAALLSIAAAGEEWQTSLAEWRNSAKKSICDYDFNSALDHIELVMQATPKEAGKIYHANKSRFDWLLSSIRLATSPDSSLSQCFVGCLSLVTDGQLAKDYYAEATNLGLLIRKIWLQRLNFRAEFQSPRASVPAVSSACEAPYSGLKLAANILIAAQTAVSTRVPETTLTTLRNLAT